jgi:type I restriction enzyme S subunit
MADQTTTIPKGWQKLPINDLVDIVVDNRGRNPDYYVLKGVPVIDNVLIKGERKINLGEARRFIDNDTYSSFIRKYNQENDVLITLVGNGYGNVALSPKGKSIIMQNTIGLRCNDSGDNVFLFYNLSLNKKLLADLNIGAAQPSIKVGDLLSVELIIPPISEQRAIAAVLSSLDDKIELLREQNKTLEATAQAIFKEWFVNFNFPGATGKMIDSELGEIPEGWRVGKIKDLIDILSGFAFSSSDFSQDGNYKLVTIKNVQDRHFDPETKDRLSALPVRMPEYCKLNSGDILLSLTGNVGRICLVNGDNFLLNQRVAKLKEKNPSDYAFTYLLFLQDSIFSLLQSTASGTAQQNLSPIQTKEIEIIIADRKTLDQFGMVANKLIQKINDNNSQVETLSKLRDTLLPKLMTGNVRVKGFED